MKGTQLFLIFIFVLCITKTNADLKPKNTLSELIQNFSANGDNLFFNSECYKINLNGHIKNIIESFIKKEFMTTLNYLIRFLEEISSKCTLELFNLSFLKNLLVELNIKSLFNLRKEKLNDSLSKVLPQSKKNLKAKNYISMIYIDDPLEAAEELFDGFWIGVAKDPKNNNCRNKLARYKSTIVLSLYDIIESLNENSGYYDTFNEVFEGLSATQNIPDCNFILLASELQNLTTIAGRKTVSDRLSNSMSQLLNIVSRGVKAADDEDYNTVGRVIGIVISVALNYKTN